MLPDLDSLALFARAAELRSLHKAAKAAKAAKGAKAAEASHIGLAAASWRMVLLEHRFKTPVLDQTSRGGEPTPTGGSLLPHAKALRVQINPMQADRLGHAHNQP